MTSSSNIPKMQYVRFGNTGMKVSKVCLGCMSFGTSKAASWIKEEKESIELIKQAYDVGINFFDTANRYSNGLSESILGKALKEIDAPRGRIVIATKVYGPVYKDVSVMHDPKLKEDPEMINCFGLSRKHIFDAIDASLERLGVDYIDLYQIHRLDRNTPMEEIMEALHDLVKSGKVRYIGASSMATWEFQKMNAIAERNGWTKFVSMQNLYNLLYREEEREMNPYCVDSGIAGIPWSPLAMGQLTGKNRDTVRSKTGFDLKNLFPTTEQQSNEVIIDRVIEVAKKLDKSPAQVAMAWLYSKPFVTAPIVGLSNINQLYDSMGGMEMKLSKEDVDYLEEPYTPRPMISN